MDGSGSGLCLVAGFGVSGVNLLVLLLQCDRSCPLIAFVFSCNDSVIVPNACA